jgi:glucose/arabinose dehydrogenase
VAVAAGAFGVRAFIVPLVLLLVLAPGCGAADPSPERVDHFTPRTGLRLETIADGFDRPLYLTAPAGDPRLFVVEQGGTIRIVRGGRVLPRPFLDLSARLRAGGEQGLLSMAFHPRYRTNGQFFVNYTDRAGDTRVERYRVAAGNPDRGDPASAQLVLKVDQPYPNHNGGHVFFGPDGMLYVGMGDGGSGGDPGNRAQDPQELLGKMLRLDVDGASPYAIPRDNPFAGRPDRGRPEIWALGLRNPWRSAFDPADGLLYIADVGQNEWEEVHVEPARRAGVNYGWNLLEGRHPYRPAGRSAAGMALPAVEYSHRDGCSITGGYVYRGRLAPGLVGHYVFSDYCHGWIRSFRFRGGRATDLTEWSGLKAGQVMSFGVDAAGELYVMNDRGVLFRLVAAPAPRR